MNFIHLIKPQDLLKPKILLLTLPDTRVIFILMIFNLQLKGEALSNFKGAIPL